MRCIAISFALLLSTLTVANAGFCGTQTSPSERCPCVGSGCTGRYCCVALAGGKNYWVRADRLWPRSRADRMSPFVYPW